MKFMKLGTRPDTFYTEQATRTLVSDIPVDLVIKINDITYLLHKSAILPKCGLLQQLCSDFSDSEPVSLELHDTPGGANAFELCAKFCYGMSINISAHNIVPAFCAAKFLQMNESIEKGNFVGKIEAFFNSCILEGWKDSIVALQATDKLPLWSEKLGIIRKCIDSIIEKILTPSPQVKWSYTYTRPGYARKQHHSVPKDWWTEDVSDLGIELFRCIIMAIRSTYVLPHQLIGEALHVYACKWLPGLTNIRSSGSSLAQTEESKAKIQKILETIVSMIPADKGSVSVGFLLKLLSISSHLGISPTTKTELIKRASIQFDEAKVSDLIYRSASSLDRNFYDTELVLAVLESFLKFWKSKPPNVVDNRQFLKSVRNVGKLIDSYLQVVARDNNMSVSKFVALAEAVPAIGRSEHDDLYQAINIYLKVHPDLSKADKRRLCRILQCQRLSPEARAHAVKNDLLPLRTVVQLVYFEQEKGSNNNKEAATTTTINNHKLQKSHHEMLQGAAEAAAKRPAMNKEELIRRMSHAESRGKVQDRSKISDGKLALEIEKKMVIGRGTKEECASECKLEMVSKKSMRKVRSNKSEHGHGNGK
ncbi:hypothetical protein PIB30_012135 [Stylosanthes scabra]|uniref:NPH3 domain-containing protein n=1 Tax=Stylosanthes scabra TaxID=79078 RepID=A0ABU6S5J8_9FABA|nr:hypothetical protein [Stylosanthes scabra]